MVYSLRFPHLDERITHNTGLCHYNSPAFLQTHSEYSTRAQYSKLEQISYLLSVPVWVTVKFCLAAIHLNMCTGKLLFLTLRALCTDGHNVTNLAASEVSMDGGTNGNASHLQMQRQTPPNQNTCCCSYRDKLK